jgi:hypothetical protein
MTATSGEFECKFLDGLLSPTPIDISVQLSDGEKLSNVESRSVRVSNVAPTLTGLGSSSQNALAGTLNPVTFTPTATDASPRDLAAGFTWQWTIDGGAYGPVGGANQLYFSTCGTHTVEAQATDKDGGVSATSPQATQSVSVYDGAFSPPLVDGSTNMVQRGQVLPVMISIGCGTTNLTDLTPHIQLLSGNVSPESEIGSTTVTSSPVSAADTTQTMRPLDGGYVYNLQVPTNAAANTEYTILVNPFGPHRGRRSHRHVPRHQDPRVGGEKKGRFDSPGAEGPGRCQTSENLYQVRLNRATFGTRVGRVPPIAVIPAKAGIHLYKEQSRDRRLAASCR